MNHEGTKGTKTHKMDEEIAEEFATEFTEDSER